MRLPARLAFVIAFALSAPAQATALKDGEGYVVSSGIKIWYRVEGAARSGLPILIIHGGPGETARPFERSIGPLLALAHPVIYTDYRGAGRSERPKELAQYSFTQLADDNEALREKLGIAAWAVFGHSNGASTAVLYAVRHPKATRALVLCDPLTNARDLEINMAHKVLAAPAEAQARLRALFQSKASTDERFEKMFELLWPSWQHQLMFYDPDNGSLFDAIQAELRSQIGKPLMAEQLLQGLLASGFFAFDALAHTRELPMPVLVLVGRVDNEISVDNAAQLAASLPVGRFVAIEHAGHFPFFEESATTAGAIERFLRDVR